METGTRYYRLLKNTGLLIVAALMVFVISACPIPLNDEMSREVMDTVAPVISVLSPVDGDAYGAKTMITGRVEDSADGGTPGKVTSLLVEILGVTGSRGISVNTNGTFSTILDTNGAGYSSDIVVKLTAIDWNSNSSEITMALRKAAGEITGFTVTPGNRSAAVSWNQLPGAESYTLKEYRSGESVTGIIDTFYIWEDLANGSKCSFRVEADIDGSTYSSEIEEAIPLAESTLTPSVESVYRGIMLTWKDIPAASEYVIERSDDKNGLYSIRTITPDSTFLDDMLERGAGFYYRIYPIERMSNPDIMVSSSTYGCAGYFHGRNDYSIFSSVDTGNSAFETVVRGNYAYIADGTDGLWIADISDIYNPVLVSNCDTPGYPSDGVNENYGNAKGIALSDNYAYIANRQSGMHIIDISNPLSPFILNVSYDSDGGLPSDINSSSGVVLSSDYSYAYVADKTSMLVLHISGPDQPELTGKWDSSEYAGKLVVDDNYAYVADGNDGLQIIDITNPASPGEVGACNTYYARGIDLLTIDSSTYACIADSDEGLKIIDITTPSSVTNSSSTGSSTTSGDNFLGIIVSETRKRAYVANSINGLSIIDVSNPADPDIIGLCDTPGDAHGVTINGDYAFVSDFNSGLQIIDISEPDVTVIRSVDTGTVVNCGITISGNYAFVTDGNPLNPDYTAGALKVFSLADPENPVLVSSDSANVENCTGIAVSGNYAYVTDYNPGLHVFDISNPSDPVLKATCDIKVTTPGRSEGIAVSGSYAYVAAKGNGLQIVDISDPDNPFLAGLCDMNTDAMNVAVSGNYAYLAGKGGGLVVMNISDPDYPYQVGSHDTIGNAYGVAVVGNYVYIADGDNGLVILDITTPESITDSSPAYTFNTAGIATGVTISGSYAFVADGAEGLNVIDVSHPEDPIDLIEISSVDTTNAKAVAVAGQYAYVADGSGGLKVIDLH